MTPAASAPVSLSSVQGRQETVLFIEDNKPMRLLMTDVFKRFHYRALVAPTVEDALRFWQDHQAEIRAVVSDCDLGHERSGVSLLREFAGAKPELVMILASGSLTPRLIRELTDTTTIKCLPKPFEFLELLRMLRAGLDSQSPPASQ